jgi:branched-chain amino acid aminotransferase
MSEIVYLNGTLIPRSQASISVMDYGFLYGFGLFETMRAYGGQVFRLDRHLSRLARSAETLGLSGGIPDLTDAVMATLQANRLSEARIRITVSFGEGGMAPDLGTCHNPTVLILASHYQPYFEAVYLQGFRAIVSAIHRNSHSPLSRLKSANYLESILARQEARAAGFDEALFLSDTGLLAEASMSNIFLVSDGILLTPSDESGILPGITREVVLELAAQLGVSAIEKSINLGEVFRAQEAFLTNSLIEIMPLTEVSGQPIGSGRPGVVTRQLMTEYRKLVNNALP